MIRSVSAQYAWRSLLRHTRRTILSVVGIGIGVSMALIATSWINGAVRMEVQAIVESGTGHLRIVPSQWLVRRENTLRVQDWQKALDAARARPGVEVAALRARANALLAFGNRAAGVELTGVQPRQEQQINRIVRRARIEGRYLEPGDAGQIVIGSTLARRLDVATGDDLYLTLSGRHGMQSAMLTIVGVMYTGSRDLDESIAHVTLSDIERITGYPGPGEITILLNDYRLVDAAREALARELPGGDRVITWRQIDPSYAAGIESDRAFMGILIAIIVTVVALGITSAQLAAVLERRRELAILSALGMKGRQVIALLLLEAGAVGVGGAAVALLLGGSISYYLASTGVDITVFMGGEAAFGDVLLDPRVHGAFGLWVLWYALAVAEAATVAATLYPAWLAVRVNPADSLRAI
jgi:ABC-type lipoprotein release transport system permease subunit